MSRSLRLVYLLHSLRSDWNNGNAHFLRGLMREMGRLGHHVTVLEEPRNWSEQNLTGEMAGPGALEQFRHEFRDLRIAERPDSGAREFEKLLGEADVVIVHEWNTPEVIEGVLALRDRAGFRALFHDTHHRASSSPEQMIRMQVARFDGVIAFGESLRAIYRERFGVRQVWVLHEAADTSVFFPRAGERRKDIVWIGNWGDDERAAEIRAFLLEPAARLRQERRTAIYGVRYPDEALHALAEAGVAYRGYLPNLDAPAVYAASGVTIHIPRQQYTAAMRGIPTIRVFEALASGIPLISAPWQDTEALFREGDFTFVTTSEQAEQAMRELLSDTVAAKMQAQRGLETVLARHTCRHRAVELSALCEEALA